MRYSVSRNPVALVVLLLSCSAMAGELESRSYPLPDHGSLVLNVPKSWREEISPPHNDFSLTIALSPEAEGDFQLLITPLWTAKPGVVLPGVDDIKRNVVQTIGRVKAQAVEEKTIIKELKERFCYRLLFLCYR